MGDLVQIAAHLVERRRCAAQFLGIDRGAAPRARAGGAKPAGTKEAGKAEPDLAGSALDGSAFVGEEPHGHGNAALPSFAAAPLVARRLRIVVGRHGRTAHSGHTTIAKRAEGAETGTVSAFRLRREGGDATGRAKPSSCQVERRQAAESRMA